MIEIDCYTTILLSSIGIGEGFRVGSYYKLFVTMSLALGRTEPFVLSS
jgi:hypothetical protein